MRQLLNTLYVTTDGAWLHLEGETVVVKIDGEKRLQVPLHHLGAMVCIGQVGMSPALMARNAEDGRSTVWLGRNGHFQARVEGPTNGNILLRQAQFRQADDPQASLELARATVAAKLRNSRQNLLRSARDNSDDEEKTALKRCADELAINLRNIAHAQDTDELRGLEGDAARRYFAQIATMIKPALREDFAFNGRNRRPPRDPVNALLSFLYALVLSDCRSALEAVGLDPQLGFLHTVRPGRPSLALDLLEEFRAPLAGRPPRPHPHQPPAAQPQRLRHQ